MTKKMLVCAGAVLCAVAGCGKESSAPATWTPNPDAAWAACPTAGGDPQNPAKCKIVVTVNSAAGTCPANAIALDKPDVALAGHGKTRLVWKLQGPYRFCPMLGDGAFLKTHDPDDQFSDPRATDNDDGDDDGSNSGCRKNFRIHDLNANTKIYGYRLLFHTKDGQTACTLDPQIRNG